MFEKFLNLVKHAVTKSVPSMLAIAQYSAYANDLETFACFLDFHVIRELRRKIQYPVTDLRVARQPPQSESQKAFKVSLLLERSNKPLP